MPESLLATVIVGALVALAVVLVLVKLYKDRKNGKSGCSSCGGCPYAGTCEKKESPKNEMQGENNHE